MFAINHAATALVLKKKFPGVSMIWLLISVQLIELLWVALNFLGIERTITDAAVHSVANIHLVHMPYSHSIVMTVVIAAAAAAVLRYGLKQSALALAVGIGILSHIVLDLLTHTADIAVLPIAGSVKLGLGVYSLPLLGFVVETAYGIWCWWVYRGSRSLLAVIVLFNVMNLSFFTAAIAGPETLLAEHPLIITAAIFLQIVATLILVGVFAKRKSAADVKSPTPLPQS
ncbi:hypothetical protein KQI65_07000 [bacterium]|nr:hypothetical protein [bacterium]